MRTPTSLLLAVLCIAFLAVPVQAPCPPDYQSCFDSAAEVQSAATINNDPALIREYLDTKAVFSKSDDVKLANKFFSDPANINANKETFQKYFSATTGVPITSFFGDIGRYSDKKLTDGEGNVIDMGKLTQSGAAGIEIQVVGKKAIVVKPGKGSSPNIVVSGTKDGTVTIEDGALTVSKGELNGHRIENGRIVFREDGKATVTANSFGSLTFKEDGTRVTYDPSRNTLDLANDDKIRITSIDSSAPGIRLKGSAEIDKGVTGDLIVAGGGQFLFNYNTWGINAKKDDVTLSFKGRPTTPNSVTSPTNNEFDIKGDSFQFIAPRFYCAACEDGTDIASLSKAELKQVQKMLAAAGYPQVGKIDGVLGPKTLGALAQMRNDLDIPTRAKADGTSIPRILNMETLRALNSPTTTDLSNPNNPVNTPLREGSTGEDVRWVQDFLCGKGYCPKGGADGKFGPNTLAAVKAYIGPSAKGWATVTKAALLDTITDPKITIEPSKGATIDLNYVTDAKKQDIVVSLKTAGEATASIGDTKLVSDGKTVTRSIVKTDAANLDMVVTFELEGGKSDKYVLNGGSFTPSPVTYTYDGPIRTIAGSGLTPDAVLANTPWIAESFCAVAGGRCDSSQYAAYLAGICAVESNCNPTNPHYASRGVYSQYQGIGQTNVPQMLQLNQRLNSYLADMRQAVDEGRLSPEAYSATSDSVNRGREMLATLRAEALKQGVDLNDIRISGQTSQQRRVLENLRSTDPRYDAGYGTILIAARHTPYISTIQNKYSDDLLLQASAGLTVQFSNGIANKISRDNWNSKLTTGPNSEYWASCTQNKACGSTVSGAVNGAYNRYGTKMERMMRQMVAVTRPPQVASR